MGLQINKHQHFRRLLANMSAFRFSAKRENNNYNSVFVATRRRLNVAAWQHGSQATWQLVPQCNGRVLSCGLVPIITLMAVHNKSTGMHN